MAKLKPTPIGAGDIEDYLKDNDDFAFEMACLAQLDKIVIGTEHGGTYSDPVTYIKRQFDIRAIYTSQRKEVGRLGFAIECKNLRANFPLVVSRVPRSWDESYHEIITNLKPEDTVIIEEPGEPSRIKPGYSIYRQNELVGKSTVQIGRQDSNNQFSANDAEVHEKWAQAIASACGFLQDARNSFSKEVYDGFFILPIVVVPDERLWVVDYLQNGQKSGQPKVVKECEFYLGYEALDTAHKRLYTFSHIHFVTLGGLLPLMNRMTQDRTTYFQLFSKHPTW